MPSPRVADTSTTCAAGRTRLRKSRKRSTSNSTYGSRSTLLSSTRSAVRNICGYFSGFVRSIGDRHDDDPAALPQVEQRRTDQVADVLDEQYRPLCRLEHPQRAGQHPGIQVAPGPGIDLY